MAAVAIGTIGWLAYLQTNSESVRARVVEQIRSQFPDIDVQVGSAWIRPLGGLWLRDVRLAKRDDPAHPFLIIASATVYHDKEQLAKGRLTIRKIELVQPLFKFRRDADGNWNLPGLPRGSRADEPLPTLIVRQGTIQFDDRIGGIQRPILELRDVSWTSLNDPVPKVTIQGQAACLLGAVKYSGTWQRPQNQFSAVVELPDYTITSEATTALSGHFAEFKDHLAGLQGKGDARLEVRYQPGARPALQPTMCIHLRQGKLNHSRLPLSPLEDIDLCVRYRNGELVLEKCSARSGTARVTVEAEAAVPWESLRFDDPDQLVHRFHFSIQNLSLSRELFEQLPVNLQRIHKDFRPNGPIGLTFKFDKRDRGWSKRCIVQPLGITAEYVDFPYPIRALHGKLEQITTSDGKDELLVNLTGMVAGEPVVIEGEHRGSGSNSYLDLRIHGRRLPLDDQLMKALGDSRESVEAFHPVGSCDFGARIRRNPGDLRSDVQIRLDFKKLAVCYDDFPYPLENLRGILRIRLNQERKLTFENFVGTHHGAEITVDGENRIGPTGHVVKLRVHAAAVPADSDLTRAMNKVGLQAAWRSLRPGGRIGFQGDIEYTAWTPLPNSAKPPRSMAITCHRFEVDSLLPDFFPYELTHVNGAMYFANGRVTLTGLEARHRESRIIIGEPAFPTIIIPKAGGGLWAQVQRFQILPLVVDEELLLALPPRLRSAVSGLEPSGPMTLFVNQFIVDSTADQPERAGRRPVAANPVRGARMSSAALNDEQPSPWIYWQNLNVRLAGASVKLGVPCDNVHGLISLTGDYRNGKLNAVEGNLLIDQTTILKQPVENVHAQLIVDSGKAPGVVQVKNIKAKIFGGDLGGDAALMVEPIIRYDVRLNALGLRLEEIDRQNRITPDGQLSGRAEAQLYLNGEGVDLNKMSGGGYIRVPKGRIYSLPPLLDLLKFLKFHTPDGTFFEEAYAKFRVQGRQVQLEQLDLLGHLISLTGEGTMNLDGSNLKLDIYTVWSRLVQLLPGPVRELPNSISRNMYKISMSGTLGGKLDFEQEAVPFIVEPIKRLLEYVQPPGDRVAGNRAASTR